MELLLLLCAPDIPSGAVAVVVSSLLFWGLLLLLLLKGDREGNNSECGGERLTNQPHGGESPGDVIPSLKNELLFMESQLGACECLFLYKRASNLFFWRSKSIYNKK